MLEGQLAGFHVPQHLDAPQLFERPPPQQPVDWALTAYALVMLAEHEHQQQKSILFLFFIIIIIVLKCLLTIELNIYMCKNL